MLVSRQRPDVAFSLGPGVSKELVGEFTGAVEAQGLRIEIEEREPELFAAMEWIVPAAALLFVTQKFVGTILQEAAKDLYPVLRRNLLEVIKKCIGPEKVLNFRLYSSTPGKVSAEEIPFFAIVAPSNDEHELVRFVFDTDLETHFHAPALTQAMTLLAQHYSEDVPNDLISRGSEMARHSNIFLVFDRNQQEWRVVDPHLEARKKHARLQDAE